MSAATTHNRDMSDILDEPIDSSGVLIGRLETWKHAVSILHGYAQAVLHKQNNVTSDLSKELKIVSEVPNFNGSSVAGSAAPSNSSASGNSAVSTAFTSLVKQTQTQLQESEKAAASIKSSILPQLEILDTDLGKHHKTLRSESHHLSKEAQKHREHTAKHLENLGRAIPASQRPAQKPDPKNDPYVLHRQVRSAAADQIVKENKLAESNVNVQSNFGSLEQHIIEVLQNAVASLNAVTQRFSQVSAQSAANTEQYFKAIQPNQEWAQFKNANSSLLVPETGYARDPNKVTFANAGAEPTVPIIEGTLDRKGTVLKGHKPGYYVLTTSGFLHQFKSADHLTDTHPELSLYIPDSQISGLPAAGSGDLSFRIVSRDYNKPVSPHHKYTFTAANHEELVAWHSALARVAGASASIGGSNMDNYEEDPGMISSPTSPTGAEPGAGLTDPAAAGSGVQPGFQQNAVPQQPLQSGLGQSAGQGQASSDLSQGVGQLNLGPQQAGTGLNRDASQLASGPQQVQSGLNRDVNQFASAPQQVQSGLNRDASQFANAPQQVQSGLRSDANQLASGPQQVQSGIRNDVNNLQSAPQQLQSGVKNDVDQFASGPQQIKSDATSNVDNLKSAPQQFQSGLKNDANQFTNAFK